MSHILLLDFTDQRENRLDFEDFRLNQDIKETIQPSYPFCICCLDRDSPMFVLGKCEHRDYLEPFLNSELKQFKQVICLHCHSVLKKIKSFQAQIIESCTMLLSGKFTNDAVNSKKLKSMTVQKVIEDIYNPLDITSEDSVNLEIHQKRVQNGPHTEQSYTMDLVQAKNMAKNFAQETSNKTQNNSNMEPFSEENSVQEQNRLNNNIKTALEILIRNNQSFVSLSSQLPFLNGENLSFLEPTLLSKEILTNIPIVPPPKMSTGTDNGLLNSSKCLETEINGTDKVFFDSLDLSPLIGKGVNTSEETVTNTKVQKEIEPNTKSNSFSKKGSKIQKSTSFLQIRRIKITHGELEQERVMQAQSEAYLRHKFRCETCLIGFNYKENSEDHMRRKHGQREREGVICLICSQVIPNPGGITEHNYRHYTRYECIPCNKRYQTHDEARRHCIKHHSTKNSMKRTSNKPSLLLKRAKLKIKPSKV